MERTKELKVERKKEVMAEVKERERELKLKNAELVCHICHGMI